MLKVFVGTMAVTDMNFKVCDSLLFRLLTFSILQSDTMELITSRYLYTKYLTYGTTVKSNLVKKLHCGVLYSLCLIDFHITFAQL